MKTVRMSTLFKGVGMLLLGCFGVTGFAVESDPVTLLNGSNGEVKGTYPTITTALQAATAGDTVKLAEGVFKENVRLDKQVDIDGCGANSVIDVGVGQISGQAGMFVTADFTTISNLKILSSGTVSTLKVSSLSNTAERVKSPRLYNVIIEGGKGLNLHGTLGAVVDSVLVRKPTKNGASISLASTSEASISNTVTEGGAWGDIAFMWDSKPYYTEPQSLTFGKGNNFTKGLIYQEGFTGKNIAFTNAPFADTAVMVSGDKCLFSSKPVSPKATVERGAFTYGFMSLANAVTFAADGEKVLLAAGDHNSSSAINVDKELHFVGPMAGIDAKTRSMTDSAPEARINVPVYVGPGGKESSFDGVMFNYSGIAVSNESACIYVQSDSFKVSNTLFRCTTYNPSGIPPWGTFKGIITTSANTVTVENNYFSGFESGVYFNPGANNISVVGNKIENTKYALRFMGSKGIVSGNEMVNCARVFELRTSLWSDFAGTGCQLLITRNNVSHEGKVSAYDVIYTEGDQSGVTVTENAFSGYSRYFMNAGAKSSKYVPYTFAADFSKNYWGSETPDFNKIFSPKTSNNFVNVYPYYTDDKRQNVKVSSFKVVKPNGDEMFYSTVQMAVLAAQTGDTVMVGPGQHEVRPMPANIFSYGGQGNWYLPIPASGVTVMGVDTDWNEVTDPAFAPVIYGEVWSQNGAWASQNMMTVIGDNVTLKSLRLMPKFEANKTVEVLGQNFTAVNVSSECNTLGKEYKIDPSGENGPTEEDVEFWQKKFSGSLYFNPQNSDKNLGTATLENVNISRAWLSCSAPQQGVLNLKNALIDFRGCGYASDAGYGMMSTNAKLDFRISGLTFKVDSTIANLNTQVASRVPAGAVVEFEGGKYILPETVTVKTDVTFCGASVTDSASFVLETGIVTNLFELVGKNAVLRSVKLTGENGSQSAVSVSAPARVENCVMSGSGYGVYLGKGSAGTIVRGNVLSNFNYGVTFGGEADESIPETLIEKNTFTNNQRGIMISTWDSPSLATGNVVVLDNDFSRTAPSTWSVAVTVAEKVDALVEIRGNTFTNYRNFIYNKSTNFTGNIYSGTHPNSVFFGTEGVKYNLGGNHWGTETPNFDTLVEKGAFNIPEFYTDSSLTAKGSIKVDIALPEGIVYAGDVRLLSAVSPNGAAFVDSATPATVLNDGKYHFNEIASVTVSAKSRYVDTPFTASFEVKELPVVDLTTKEVIHFAADGIGDGSENAPARITRIEDALMKDNVTLKVDTGDLVLNNPVELGKGSSLEGNGNTTVYGGIVIGSSEIPRKNGIFYAAAPASNPARVFNMIIDGSSDSHNATGVILHANGIIDSCILRNWTATDSDGGALYMFGGQVVNSTLTGNKGARGGAVYMKSGSVDSTIVSGNYATVRAGGIFVENGMVSNTSILSNCAESWFGGIELQNKAVLDGSWVEGNQTLKALVGANDGGFGGGVGMRHETVMRNSLVKDNSASYVGGGLYVRYPTDVKIENVTFEGDSSLGGTAAYIEAVVGSPVTFSRCRFIANRSHKLGAQVVKSSGDVKFLSSLFANNTDLVGITGNASTIVDGCTFVGNRNSYTGMTAVNSLCWGNVVKTNDDTVDPRFKDFANGDYSLSERSPCIDAGTASVNVTEFDINGDTRVVGTKARAARVDRGAFEYQDVFVIPVPGENGQIFVAEEGTGERNGSSPENAYSGNGLQYLLDDLKADTQGVKSIQLANGTYYGNFKMVEGVNVCGTDSALTILDAEKSGRVVTQPEAFTVETVWSNLTIQNGLFKLDQKDNRGAGILLRQNGVLQNAIVAQNKSELTYGGGVWFDIGGKVDNCWIHHNEGTHGGGIHQSGDFGRAVTISNCLIEDNTATAWGGGANLQYGVISNTKVLRNKAVGMGGGMRISGNASFASVVSNCLFAENTVDANDGASSGGAGLALVESVSVLNCSMLNNTLVNIAPNSDGRGAGLGIFWKGTASVVKNSVMWGNTIIDGNAVAETSADLYLGLTQAVDADTMIRNTVLGKGQVNQSTEFTFHESVLRVDPLLDAGFVPGISSVCIDGADSDVSISENDLNRKVRRIALDPAENASNLDIGAFEYDGPAPDVVISANANLQPIAYGQVSPVDTAACFKDVAATFAGRKVQKIAFAHTYIKDGAEYVPGTVLNVGSYSGKLAAQTPYSGSQAVDAPVLTVIPADVNITNINATSVVYPKDYTSSTVTATVTAMVGGQSVNVPGTWAWSAQTLNEAIFTPTADTLYKVQTQTIPVTVLANKTLVSLNKTELVFTKDGSGNWTSQTVELTPSFETADAWNEADASLSATALDGFTVSPSYENNKFTLTLTPHQPASGNVDFQLDAVTGKYAASNTVSLTLTAADQKVEFTIPENQQLTYNADAQKGLYSAKVGGVTLTEDKLNATYNHSADLPFNAGVYEMTVVADGGSAYYGSKTVELTVNAYPLHTDSYVFSDTRAVYNGQPHALTVTVDTKWLPRNIAMADTEWTVSEPSGRINVGSYEYAFRPVLGGNFSGAEVSKTFEVVPFEPSSVTFANLNQKFGDVIVPVTIGVDGFDDITYTVTYNGSKTVPSQAGNYAVEAKLEGNFGGSFSATLVIAPKSSELVRIADDEWIYSGETVGVKLFDGDRQLEADTDYTVAYEGTPLNVGDYPFTVTLKGNYEGEMSSVLTIDPVMIPESKISIGDLKQSVSNIHAVTVNILPMTPMPKSSDYIVTYDDLTTLPKEVGVYAVEVTFVGNFEGLAEAELEIEAVEDPVRPTLEKEIAPGASVSVDFATIGLSPEGSKPRTDALYYKPFKPGARRERLFVGVKLSGSDTMVLKPSGAIALWNKALYKRESKTKFTKDLIVRSDIQTDSLKVPVIFRQKSCVADSTLTLVMKPARVDSVIVLMDALTKQRYLCVYGDNFGTRAKVGFEFERMNGTIVHRSGSIVRKSLMLKDGSGVSHVFTKGEDRNKRMLLRLSRYYDDPSIERLDLTVNNRNGYGALTIKPKS